MATMIPDDVDFFGTDWERQFYGFLKTAAKPEINKCAPDLISSQYGSDS